ncbi:polysaccharide export protein [Legionella lytica]|uniref:Polysaccharide export protein n=1 Tax=Legionella lytica TaxID=96232 RepID=A0ABY4Y810_9GAMM|nr:polysaccharide biosynthesis/export family protein [Legionella lytica]USQ13751.1 polysaccharide export protein [Legionella lytica]
MLVYVIRSSFLGFLTGSMLTGCATNPAWLSSSGPSRVQVMNSPAHGIRVVQVSSEVAQRLNTYRHKQLFSEIFPLSHQARDKIGTGDVIEVSLWEAPPAMLFNSSVINPTGQSTTQVTIFPGQMVNSKGYIRIPFAGNIRAAGRTPAQVEATIIAQLKGKSHNPQVLVRIAANNSSDITVVGEVAASRRVPLTPHRERLLDALAAAGGVRQDVNKITLQVTRGNKVGALPLAQIISDPKQNIELQAGDVVTALFKPHSFTVLGATGKNEEINFEAQGVSLAQALARAGGLQDIRADARAIFIFRFEERNVLANSLKTKSQSRYIPIIYQVNLRDPSNFFITQQFMINNNDVLYVSNAPAVDLQKLLNIMVSAVYPVVNIGAMTIDRI